jgi:hypothetical protein
LVYVLVACGSITGSNLMSEIIARMVNQEKMFHKFTN